MSNLKMYYQLKMSKKSDQDFKTWIPDNKTPKP